MHTMGNVRLETHECEPLALWLLDTSYRVNRQLQGKDLSIKSTVHAAKLHSSVVFFLSTLVHLINKSEYCSSSLSLDLADQPQSRLFGNN